jgi:hypothetical protein
MVSSSGRHNKLNVHVSNIQFQIHETKSDKSVKMRKETHKVNILTFLLPCRTPHLNLIDTHRTLTTTSSENTFFPQVERQYLQK